MLLGISVILLILVVFIDMGEIMKVLKNVENLKVDFFNNEYFMDTCKMAGTLGMLIVLGVLKG
jgi:hypothetical protein